MDTTNDQIYTTNNSEYTNASAIDIRLKTDYLLTQIEKQLRGSSQIVVYDEETGKQSIEKHDFGKPLANNEGVQEIMSFISGIVSPSSVSGNFKEDYFHDYIQDFENTFCKMLVKNRLRWEMTISGLTSVYNSILFLIIPFMSRLINDGERKSLSFSTHTQETNTVKDSSGFNLFGGKKN